MDNLIQQYLFFFAAIDPLGTVPVFIAVTAMMTRKQCIEVAIRSSIIALFVLIFFVVAGELLLTAVDIPLSAFQIAGGIILFLFSLTMIFGDSKPEGEIELLRCHHQSAVFPIAIPSIASPAAILAAVILTEKNRFNIFEQLVTTLSMALVILTTLVLMLCATVIHRFVGDSGAAVISRVMGMILASLAVTHVLAGISSYFQLVVDPR